jgi:hypothetical protein
VLATLLPWVRQEPLSCPLLVSGHSSSDMRLEEHSCS